MTATVELSASLRALVEARLDAIDRVLMDGGTPRWERRDIVQSVEDQIDEMIARQNDGEPTRASVLRVLGKLDPPEAYASEDWPQRTKNKRAANTAESAQTNDESSRGRSEVADARLQYSPTAIVGCVFSGLAFLLGTFGVLLQEGNKAILLGCLLFAGVGLICGCVGLVRQLSAHGNIARYVPGLAAMGVPAFMFVALCWLMMN